MTRRGAFVVVEGLDRSGKTTQTGILRQRIQEAGKEVFCVKFPVAEVAVDRSTPIGKMIDAYLRSQSDLDDHVVHLLFSANRWELALVLYSRINHTSDFDDRTISDCFIAWFNLQHALIHVTTRLISSTIISSLEQGKIVLCDRYAFSGIAFSVAKSLPSQSSPSTTSQTPGKLPPISLHWARAPDAALPSPDLTLFLDVSPEIALTRGGYGEERYEKADMQKRVRSVFQEIGGEVTADAGQGKWIVVDAGKEMSAVTEEMWGHVQTLLDGINGSIGRLWD
ncbi:P-loop containing nucleoside triphosphate hydrolase protein [Lentinula guzmanii]|uniref:dTMP kinase n=1 Tax=Lentinula guzmanii TaxID=2804957 RepID=A0AA38JM47_9AGAR|nr:P-loop containing nucleoside triphosphate hydrolase protein [Lentinula guzmanii]